jgi:D-glycero-D-manno-heptose 1,7-bisphosphate phosphatase
VFFDRDGTLIFDVPYLGDPALLRLVPSAVAALCRLRDAGFACVVVSNQSAVGRGYITEAQVHEVHAELVRQLEAGGAALDGIYYCTVAPQTEDKTAVEHPDRKPGPGMLQRAARELALDLAQSWIVGDQVADMLAGTNAGCRGGILVRTGQDPAKALSVLGPDWPVVDDVDAAARVILGRSRW